MALIKMVSFERKKNNHDRNLVMPRKKKYCRTLPFYGFLYFFCWPHLKCKQNEEVFWIPLSLDSTLISFGDTVKEVALKFIFFSIFFFTLSGASVLHAHDVIIRKFLLHFTCVYRKCHFHFMRNVFFFVTLTLMDFPRPTEEWTKRRRIICEN